jgi:hypothetical protein
MFASELGHIGLSKEASSGLFANPSKYLLVTSAEINPDTDLLIPDAEVGGGRDIVDGGVAHGTIKWSGSLDYYLRPEAIGLLLLGATGAVVSSGISGSAYGHQFKMIDYLQPLCIEQNVASTLDTLDYTDVKVNSFHIEASAGEFVTGSSEIVAIAVTAGGVNHTPTFETAPVFTYAGGYVELEGAQISVKSFSFDVNNNLVDDDFRIGSRTLASLVEKRREVTASLEIAPSDNTLFRKSVFGSSTAAAASGSQQLYSGSLFLRLESPTSIPGSAVRYQMDINIPKAIFEASPLPQSGDDLVVQTLSMRAVKTAGQDVATIVLRNATSSY